MEQTRQYVAVDGLRFFAYHGYYPDEQVVGNEFVVSIRAAFIKHKGTSENLHHTINYERLYQIARTEMEDTRKLLETVADSILNQIKLEFPFVDETEITIRKTEPPFGADGAHATVILHWRKETAM